MPEFDDYEYERLHLVRIEKYATQIDRIYKKAIGEFAKLAASLPSVNPDKLFSFSDYPSTNKVVKEILERTYSGMLGTINQGIKYEWEAAGSKNDDLIRKVKKISKVDWEELNKENGRSIEKIMHSSGLSKKQLAQYTDRNLKALESFQKRKSDGLGLSQRVWNYTGNFKNEVELGLDVGLGEGKSAANISRILRQNLEDPDKLFRRVLSKRGNLVLSKHAQQFNPGTGVYRSSYKNAMRLARTETNMAYRASDHERWNKLDFVVGTEIRLSNNPNHCPVCESLAGKYPKAFKFVGWHPQCRCRQISILKTDEEIDADDIRILQGKEPLPSSVNEVTDVPANFKKWITDNKERAARAKSTPYWIRDNFKDGNLEKGLKFNTKAVKPIKSDTPKYKPYGILKYQKELGIKVNDDIFRLLKSETPLIHDDPKGAYFLPSSNVINIPFDERRRSSKWGAESVVYHEYGHAADWQNNLKNMPEVKDLMDKFRKSFRKNKNYEYIAIDDELWRIGRKSYFDGDKDVSAQAGAAHDTLMSLNSNFGAGHSKAYFKQPGLSEAEFIAHMFENKFIGNPIFKKVMPELYDEMITLADLIIERFSR